MILFPDEFYYFPSFNYLLYVVFNYLVYVVVVNTVLSFALELLDSSEKNARHDSLENLLLSLSFYYRVFQKFIQVQHVSIFRSEA
jgi:hypothetical protein